MKSYTASEIFEGLRAGDKRMLAKGITLIESRNPAHREQAEALLDLAIPYTGNSIRVGITGVPGAGKSTFIESFGSLLTENDHRVAVLAIDPSSHKNSGSILGDKTRMETLSRNDRAFIRPSPTAGFLGGVANATFEAMLLCEAAGYDFILIETVGVGQSEVLVSEITDVFLFLKIIGGGDELQGIKRGIMEMVDLIFINKVSPENQAAAQHTRQELLRALQFMPHDSKEWKVPVLLGSALENRGIDTVYEKILSFIKLRKQDGSFLTSRQHQSEKRFRFWLQYYLLQQLSQQRDEQDYKEILAKIGSGQSNPRSEAQKFLKKLL